MKELVYVYIFWGLAAVWLLMSLLSGKQRIISSLIYFLFGFALGVIGLFYGGVWLTGSPRFAWRHLLILIPLISFNFWLVNLKLKRYVTSYSKHRERKDKTETTGQLMQTEKPSANLFVRVKNKILSGFSDFH